MGDKDIDLASLSETQVLQGLGDLARSLLRSKRVAVFFLREDSAVTIVDPGVIAALPPEALIAALVDSWEETQIQEFLEHVYGD
tara:strand:+ start:282 stop:533 length:252 start_codon:yes stop_codon:yes gene_type:complete